MNAIQYAWAVGVPWNQIRPVLRSYNITSCLFTVRDSRHAQTNSRRLNKNPTIGENQPEKYEKKNIDKTD